MQRIRQINFFFKTIVFNRKLISLPKIQQLETTMLARDLIATVIKTFFEELDDVRDGKRQMNDESPYAGMYASYFNKDRDCLSRPIPKRSRLFLQTIRSINWKC